MGAAINLLGPASVSTTAALIGDSVQSPPLSAGLPAYGSDGMPSLTQTTNASGQTVPIPVALELQSTLGSFVIPRMTLAERNAMDATGISVDGSVVCVVANPPASPATTGNWWFKQAGAWVQFTNGAPGGNLVAAATPVVQDSISYWSNTTSTIAGILPGAAAGAAITYNAGTLSLNVPTPFQILGTGAVLATLPYSFIGNLTCGMTSMTNTSVSLVGDGAEALRANNTGATGYFQVSNLANETQLQTVSATAGDDIALTLVTKGTGGVLLAPTVTADVACPLTFVAPNFNYVTLVAANALAVSYTLTLPTAVPANNQVIVVNNAGQLSFEATPLSSPLLSLTGTITTAAFLTMAGAPIQLVGAAGANIVIAVQSITFEVVYGGTQYTDGGPVILQYGNTVNAGGPPCTADIAAATFNNANADLLIYAQGFVGAPSVPTATSANQGIFLSSEANFATGNSNVNFTIYYTYITVS